MSAAIQEAKQALPLPKLCEQLGIELKNCKGKVPWREDKHPSFSIFKKENQQWGWKDHGKNESGDEINLIEKMKGVSSKDAISEFLSMSGVQSNQGNQPTIYKLKKTSTESTMQKPSKPINWKECVDAFDDDDIKYISKWRGYSIEFCQWLKSQSLIGEYKGNLALPVHDENGEVRAVHVKREHSWHYDGEDRSVTPLVIGDKNKYRAFVCESQWDAFALGECLDLHYFTSPNDAEFSIITTRGATNAKLLSKVLPESLEEIVIVPQNDEAGAKWEKEVIQLFPNIAIKKINLPQKFKDLNDWQKEGGATEIIGAVSNMSVIQKSSKLPPLQSPLELSKKEINHGDTILGNRWLCKKGAAIIGAASGVGKSSVVVQMAFDWSCGRESFGIKPARPLRILIVQAENDEGDTIEQARGIVDQSNYSEHEQELIKSNFFMDSDRVSQGDELISRLQKRLDQYGLFDLVIIDPLQSFAACEVIDVAGIKGFLQTGIGSLSDKYGFATIFVHHFPKTTNQDTTGWTASQWQYQIAGSAYISNWARAILVINDMGDKTNFRFIAAKRNKQIGWKDSNGNYTWEKYFRHSREQGRIYWEEVIGDDLSEMKTLSQKKKSPQKVVVTDEQIIAFVPMYCVIPKSDLESKIEALGVGENRAIKLVKRLVDTGKLFVHKTKRAKTNPLQSISRIPQTEVKDAPQNEAESDAIETSTGDLNAV